jgi:FMN-dependent oxidoreductase (nitrilotriacetate monooxygenase family)
MHLAADLSFAHANGTWRGNGSWVGYPYYGRPEMYEELARIAERGFFDMVFFGDAAETPHDADGDFADAVRYGVNWPKLDMMPTVVAMSRVTRHLGFGLTMSTTYHHPFHVARLFTSLDHMTGGRIAWNAVTSAYRNEARCWGYDDILDHEARYARAREHLDATKALWNSVDTDAVVMDPATGVFADPTKVRHVDFAGEHFRIKGPLPVLPGPQHTPPIIQAGQSSSGLALGALHADYQFAANGTVETMRDHRAAMDKALAAVGREDRDVGMLWSIRVEVLDSPDDLARRDQAYLDMQPPGAPIKNMSALFGVDFSRYAPDTPLGEIVDDVRAAHTHWGYLADAVESAGADTPLLAYAEHRLLRGAAEAVGTPEQIADRMEELHEATGRNGGFILSRFSEVPGTLRRFVDEVVPVLQMRGLVRTSYTGATLRENLLT